MYSYFIYFLLFFFGSIISLLIIIPIIFTIYVLYITLFRISYKEIDFFHNFCESFNKFLSKYMKSDKNFPVTFIDKDSISQNKQYLYVFYPHGMFAVSALAHLFNTNSSLYPYLKNAKNTGHSIMFSLPIFREISLLLKGIPVSREYIDHYLQKGHSITINPAGIHDVRYSIYKNKNKDHLFIKKRKGFIHTAKDNNIEIVPIYCWGEQQTIIHTKMFDPINKLLHDIFGIKFDCNVFQGLGPTNIIKVLSLLFGSEKGGTLYVGKPISINEKTADIIHEEFIQSMKDIFEFAKRDQKSEKKLIIV